MSNKTRRLAGAALAASAAFAMVAPNAFAAADDAPPIQIDGNVVYATDGPYVGRIADTDRVATAIKALCSRDDWSQTVILAHSGASKSDFAPDALASAPLADVLDAPVLVTAAGDALDPRLVSLFVVGCDGKKGTADDKRFNDVRITTGTGVLTDKIVKQLKAAPVWKADGSLDTTKGAGIATVERYSGANRYQTSTEIARQVAWWFDQNNLDHMDVFVADGNNFPDALAAGAAAAQHNGVVLLSMGSSGMDESTFKFASNGAYAADNMAHRQIWAVGGNAAKAVKAGWLGQPVEATNVVVGADRYETAAMLAKQVFGTGADAPVDYVVASGETYADAVFAGAYAANLDGPLLLTSEASLSAPTADYLKSTAPAKSRVIVFGGTGSVSTAVQGQLVTALTKI